jgi:segregation and condensation protein B
MSIKSIIESILFSIGEPISIEKIAKTIGENRDSVKIIIDELEKEYENQNRGLRIIKKGEEIQLVSSPSNSNYIEKLIKNELQEDLTPASLEVLAIVAYRGPITRAEIEEIRGVNSSFTLRNLLIRGLVGRRGRPEDSRAYIYEISFDFLKKLGLKSIEELPEYKKLNNL